MLRFFCQIRQRLLTENRFSKYLLYAVGEILLVVIGILIALQVDNWNEARKQHNQFNLALEQAYNSIDLINKQLILADELNKSVIRFIDLLLEQSDTIPNGILPHMLLYVDQEIGLINSATSNQFTPFSEELDPDPNDTSQIQLAKEISTYFKSQLWDLKQNENLIRPIFYEEGIPIVSVVLGYSSMDNFSRVDTLFYTSEEQKKVRSLLNSESIKRALRSLKSNREVAFELSLRNSLADGLSIQRTIKSYYPGVRLRYEDVGIIGTAIEGYDDVGAKSTPMTLTNAEKSIWEIEMYLKSGTVKYRTRYSWNQNWGGSEFPKGKAVFYWEDISVNEGRYHIVLNLSENLYEFRPIE